VVSITARYTGSYTDWDVPHEMSGILLGNADSTGISNSHTLMGFHMGSFRQVLCPDPWNTGDVDRRLHSGPAAYDHSA